MPDLILLVDDEPSIVQLSRMYLEREGFNVESAGDGETALEAAAKLKPVLMVLDVMLPKVDGFEVCRRLQAEKNPILIIMLTARDEDVDKIIGLELGADDYLTKPFNPRELVARVKALLRRKERKLNSETTLLQVGDLKIDRAAREVRMGESLAALRTQEFDLLVVLAENHGRVLSREKLLELAWGFDYYGQTRTVDVHIGHLRRKLSGSSIRIETVPGVGYKLVNQQSNN
jgi:DNA-binding response OmpR family regulator